MRRIDLNCDLGEGAGHDAELMPLITSANIACGAHAGDEATMRATVELAKAHGVAIGAHPGFEDREHFGRRELSVASEEVYRLVFEQTRALQQIAEEAGQRVGHVKPHGALYNLAARVPRIADAVARAVQAAGAELVLFGLAASESGRAADRVGLTFAHEIFADRNYRTDGSLVPRTEPNALIEDGDAAAEQVRRFLREGRPADTVCLHGDGAHAVAFAHKLRQALRAGQVEVRAFRS